MTATSQPLLEATGLERRFGNRPAVRGVDLAVRRGEVVGLLGPNGAGKSTTLDLLCGVLAPSAGRIRLDGVDLLDEPVSARARLGYLPEAAPVDPTARVGDFLHWAARLRRVPRSWRHTLVERAIERCALGEVRRRVIRNLSQGFRQRVGIAQAIVHEPALIVLDEPTVGLDPRQLHGVRDLIDTLRPDHGILFSSHILAEVQAVSDRVTILHHGRAVYSGAVSGADDHPPRYLLRFAAPPPAAELAGLPGVRRVDAGPARSLLLTLETEDALDGITARAAEAQWGLRELSRDRLALERVFLDLTQSEEEETP